MLQLPESEFIIGMLNRYLSPDLYYHTIGHTLDVFEMSKYYAEKEYVEGSGLKLLLISALYHDSGYLHQREDHEHRSCEIAKAVLPGFSYSESDIGTVCSIIMATKLPQQPSSLLEQIICDADLDYLGRDDFFEIGNRLYRELFAVGLVANENDWDMIQVDFLQKHRYFTATAKQMRNQKKEENLNILLSKITPAK